MATFLIHNKTHWMELPSKLQPDRTGYERHQDLIDANSDLSSVQKAISKDKLTLKYNRRIRKHDILEARPASVKRGKLEEDSFIFIHVHDMLLKEAQNYNVPKEDITDPLEPIILRDHKYYIELLGLTPDIHKNITLTKTQFLDRLKVK